MILSNVQRKLLNRYMGYRAKPPTALGLLAKSAPRYIVVTAILGAAALLSLEPDERSIAFVALGMWIGITTGYLREIIAALRLWPVVAAVLDWNKIDELLDGDRPTQS